MRILTPLQALSAAAALALLAGCSGGSAIAPNPSTPRGFIPMTMGGIVAPVGQLPQPNAIIADVPLGSDSRFAVLAGSTVTNSGPTIVTSNLGLSPGSAVTGFPPGIVKDGKIHAGDIHAAQAQLDLTTAYNNAAGRKNPTKVPADIGGMVIGPGLYKAPVSLAITGNLTLDGQNKKNGVFIFQVPSTLTTSVNSSITLINMAKPCHIFWQVGSSATLKTGSVFKGVILAQASISLGKGVSVEDGRLLARSGAVTLLRDIVTEPGP
ncbi:MAG TPA: ice-binding family protein [Candidatus Eremiobacteraceae bacterium]